MTEATISTPAVKLLMPDLSVIIPSYSRPDLLAACLDSVIQHSSTIHTEVIVVDDASSNSSVSRAAGQFPAVRIIRLPRRSGFCRAINAGLQRATSTIVQILNDDTEVLPAWYRSPLERFQRDERLGSLAPLVLCWKDPRIIDSAGDSYDPGGYAFSRGKGEKVATRWLVPREVFSAAGSAAFYRREALHRVGGFPEEFIAYFDDIEVGFKLREAGYTCWYEPASRVLHHGSASRRPSRVLTQQLACNEERVFCRHLQPGKRWEQLARHVAVLGGKALRRWADGTLMPFCLGRVQAWSEAAAGR